MACEAVDQAWWTARGPISPSLRPLQYWTEFRKHDRSLVGFVRPAPALCRDGCACSGTVPGAEGRGSVLGLGLTSPFCSRGLWAQLAPCARPVPGPEKLPAKPGLKGLLTPSSVGVMRNVP